MKKKRVLILSASAGTGHGRAAEALAKVFAADERVEAVEHFDALQYTNKLFPGLCVGMRYLDRRTREGIRSRFADRRDEF